MSELLRKKAKFEVVSVRTSEDAPDSKRMFSPASFFDVIDSIHGNGACPLPEPTTIPKRPATVAFYGFRGGAGRTVALAHVAIVLAQRGLRIAAVDCDLEAPGLHVALGTESPHRGQRAGPALNQDAKCACRSSRACRRASSGCDSEGRDGKKCYSFPLAA